MMLLLGTRSFFPPFAWNPCSNVHYVFSLQGVPLNIQDMAPLDGCTITGTVHHWAVWLIPKGPIKHCSLGLTQPLNGSKSPVPTTRLLTISCVSHCLERLSSVLVATIPLGQASLFDRVKKKCGRMERAYGHIQGALIPGGFDCQELSLGTERDPAQWSQCHLCWEIPCMTTCRRRDPDASPWELLPGYTWASHVWMSFLQTQGAKFSMNGAWLCHWCLKTSFELTGSIFVMNSELLGKEKMAFKIWQQPESVNQTPSREVSCCMEDLLICHDVTCTSAFYSPGIDGNNARASPGFPLHAPQPD